MKNTKQLKLFNLISFNRKKNIYYIDLPNNKIGEVHVDANDNILKTKGLGYRARVVANGGLSKGKSFCEAWYHDNQEDYRKKTNYYGSSNLLPVTTSNQKINVNFLVHKKNVTHLDKAIANYKKAGYSITECNRGESFYVHN